MPCCVQGGNNGTADASGQASIVVPTSTVDGIRCGEGTPVDRSHVLNRRWFASGAASTTTGREGIAQAALSAINAMNVYVVLGASATVLFALLAVYACAVTRLRHLQDRRRAFMHRIRAEGMLDLHDNRDSMVGNWRQHPSLSPSLKGSLARRPKPNAADLPTSPVPVSSNKQDDVVVVAKAFDIPDTFRSAAATTSPQHNAAFAIPAAFQMPKPPS